MNEGHTEFYDPNDTGRCQIITGVGHFPEAKPSRCWLTKQQHEERPAQRCMVCDLYGVIDRHGDPSSDFVAGLVGVLPPRGHAFHGGSGGRV